MDALNNVPSWYYNFVVGWFIAAIIACVGCCVAVRKGWGPR